MAWPWASRVRCIWREYARWGVDRAGGMSVWSSAFWGGRDLNGSLKSAKKGPSVMDMVTNRLQRRTWPAIASVSSCPVCFCAQIEATLLG